jgi:hypothetical protein
MVCREPMKRAPERVRKLTPSRRAAWLVAAAIWASACSASMDPLPYAGGGGGSAGSGGGSSGAGGASAGSGGQADPGGDGSTPEGLVIAGQVVDVRTRRPVEQALVSVAGRAELSVMTGADGRFRLVGVPKPADVKIEKTGYVADTLAIRSGAATLTLPPLRMFPIDDPDAFANAAGPAMDAARGHILAEAFTAGVAGYTPATGVTVALATPASGSGPSYLDDNDMRDEARADTSMRGAALFLNVTPGEVEVRFTHSTLRCAPIYGEAGMMPGSVKVTVAAGTLASGAAVVCTPP